MKTAIKIIGVTLIVFVIVFCSLLNQPQVDNTCLYRDCTVPINVYSDFKVDTVINPANLNHSEIKTIAK